MKTLSYRMDAHCRNAQRVAEFLEAHEMVERVIFPGLASHPQFDLGARQMTGPGGIVSFEVRGGHDAGMAVIDHVRMISIAVSLGDIESLIEHPASMTHSTYTAEEREAAGITDGLVRIAVGLESPEDIVSDLDQAFVAARRISCSRASVESRVVAV